MQPALPSPSGSQAGLFMPNVFLWVSLGTGNEKETWPNASSSCLGYDISFSRSCVLWLLDLCSGDKKLPLHHKGGAVFNYCL